MDSLKQLKQVKCSLLQMPCFSLVSKAKSFGLRRLWTEKTTESTWYLLTLLRSKRAEFTKTAFCTPISVLATIMRQAKIKEHATFLRENRKWSKFTTKSWSFSATSKMARSFQFLAFVWNQAKSWFSWKVLAFSFTSMFQNLNNTNMEIILRR